MGNNKITNDVQRIHELGHVVADLWTKLHDSNDLLTKIYKHFTSTEIPRGSWQLMGEVEDYLKEQKLI